MKALIFSIYDAKAEAHVGGLMCFLAPGQAIRAFADMCNDSSTTIGKHPGDYRLYRVGEFDDSTGAIVSEFTPVLLSTGDQAVGERPEHGLRAL